MTGEFDLWCFRFARENGFGRGGRVGGGLVERWGGLREVNID